ncbi:MAG: energy transducer TonB [Bacteroidota bacterium]
MKKSNTKNATSHGNGSNAKATHAFHKNGKQETNLRKRGFLHFQIGLILAMLLVYVGLEASFRTMKTEPIREHTMEEGIVEYYQELNKFKVEKTKKKKVVPKKVTNPADFDIIDDDVDTSDLDEFIDVPNDETDPELKTGDIDFIQESTPMGDIEFILVEDVPIFPGCEKVEKEERRACFQEKMNKHVKRYVRYPRAEQELGIKGKVHIRFKIDVDGTITDIEMKGPSKGLENEAARVIEKLPKMTPGKQRGTPVRVPFSLPINFQ